MSEIVDRVVEALDAIRRARRVLFVHPDDFGPVTARIYADGMSGMVRVEQDRNVEPGQLILVNPNLPDVPGLRPEQLGSFRSTDVQHCWPHIVPTVGYGTVLVNPL